MLRTVPIVGGSYSDSSRPYDSQECVNYLPEPAEVGNARSQGILRGVPGMVLAFNMETTTGVHSLGRGIRNVEGKLFIVQGSGLYEINPTTFAPTFRGTIPGTGRVSMSHNQVNGGNQLTIVNGPTGYVWDTAASTFTQITDDAFTGSSVTGYIDTYMVQLEPLGGYWYISDSADALSYNSLNRFDAESEPDIIKTLLVDHREVWAFGSDTIEQFVDTAGTDGTATIFTRQSGTLMQIGIAGKNTAVALDNTVYWMGSDGIIYRAAGGYIPQRVSTFAIEQEIQGKDWDNAYAFAWTDRGHKVYYITFPDGYTWGFDVSNSLWHRRSSYGLDCWRINNLVYWQNNWYGTDFSSGKVYRLDWETYQDDGMPLVSMRQTPTSHNAENKLFLKSLSLYMNCGIGPVDPDSYVNFRYSDDGGFTWSSWKGISLDRVRNNGDRILFRRLGTYRDRVFQVQVSANCRRDIIDCSIDLATES